MPLPDEARSRPAGIRTAPEATTTTDAEVKNHNSRPRRQRTFVVDREQTSLRFFQDLLAGGLAATHLRRADALEWAISRPGDFVGQSTPQERAARDARLRTDADRCRWHAALLLETHAEAYAPDVAAVLREVA